MVAARWKAAREPLRCTSSSMRRRSSSLAGTQSRAMLHKQVVRCCSRKASISCLTPSPGAMDQVYGAMRRSSNAFRARVVVCTDSRRCRCGSLLVYGARGRRGTGITAHSGGVAAMMKAMSIRARRRLLAAGSTLLAVALGLGVAEVLFARRDADAFPRPLLRNRPRCSFSQTLTQTSKPIPSTSCAPTAAGRQVSGFRGSELVHGEVGA